MMRKFYSSSCATKCTIKLFLRIELDMLLQGVKILFNPNFLAKSYFVLFFGKCPILSFFLAIFPLILLFYSLFITIISHKNIP